MKQIRDHSNRRICDLSDDGKTIFIRRRDSVTVITVQKNGSMKVTVLRQAKEK